MCPRPITPMRYLFAMRRPPLSITRSLRNRNLCHPAELLNPGGDLRIEAGEHFPVELRVRLPRLRGHHPAIANSLLGAVRPAVRLDLEAHVLVSREAIALRQPRG